MRSVDCLLHPEVREIVARRVLERCAVAQVCDDVPLQPFAGAAAEGVDRTGVVDVLAREFSNLKRFSTLSPIPSFSRWLDKRLDEEGDTELLTVSERRALGLQPSGHRDADSLKALLRDPNWHADPELSKALRAPLLRLCATYLLSAKRDNMYATDSVAHFHLSNGARIDRLNWLADTSERGMAQSAGMMVNYRYRLDQIEGNHEAYTGEGLVTATSTVRKLI